MIDGKKFPLKNKRTFGEKGQLSVFLGIAMIVVITLFAFVINIGLFVKAKINLQNAVDAAAWSGAAVQARQLSNIAYLNWEMRNTYKEWMFKLYVLGQASNNSIADGSLGTTTNFRAKDFGSPTYNDDTFNIPSTCLHFQAAAATTNICDIASTPGLPRFTSISTPDVAEALETAIDSMVRLKSKNCGARTVLNWAATTTWTYGTGEKVINTPVVAINRTGAWIQSLELAFRMRNLENIVNRPPVATPICLGGVNCTSIFSLSDPVADERPIKAFWAAAKNLSGGSFKEDDSPSEQDELYSNFSMQEIAPDPYEVKANTLSSLLLPAEVHQKHYLDLLPMPLNFTAFFNFFLSTDGDSTSIDNVQENAICQVKKTAIPVPGYILGFLKNPEVLTYYALKGETKFIGMFFPFQKRDGITISAYAAAKPFGGRIGPMLFGLNPQKTGIITRKSPNARSIQYVSTFEPPVPEIFSDRTPIPYTADFFADSAPDKVIGGVPGATEKPRFVLPNFVYDFPVPDNGGRPIAVIKSTLTEPQPANSAGLYDKSQFAIFRSSAGPTIGIGLLNLSNDQIDMAIEKIRAPTKYDAANYLIPIISDIQGGKIAGASPKLESALNVRSGPNGHPSSYSYDLFAPLFGNNSLYNDPTAFENVLRNYMKQNRAAIEDAYLPALYKTANSVAEQVAAETAPSILKGIFSSSPPPDFSQAATYVKNEIQDVCVAQGAPDNGALSLAAKIYVVIFGRGDDNPSSEKICGVTPLVDSFNSYLVNQKQINPNFEGVYTSTYYRPDNFDNSTISTGYMPGSRQGAEDSTAEGMFATAASSSGTKGLFHKRNYYSTKFVPVAMVTNNQSSGTSFATRGGGRDIIYREGTFLENLESGTPGDLKTLFDAPQNLINPGTLSTLNIKDPTF